MVIWTVPQQEISDTPAFELSGVFVSWPDGAPAILKQTAFRWQDDAWQASVEVSSLGENPRYAYGTIRLKPAVAAAWQRGRVNPRREAAEQLRRVMRCGPHSSDLGIVTFRSS
jgi:hypothetical protein